MRIFLITFFLSISFVGFSQRDDLHGTVIDSISGDGLIGVHIGNLNSKKLTVTSIDGDFSIPVKENDTLVISHIGYKKETFIVATGWSDNLIISLTPQAIKLDEVQVSLLPEYQRFKQLVIETQPMDSSLVVFGLDAIPLDAYEKSANELKVGPTDLMAPAIGIGFDLGKLTKRHKEKKKLQKILARRELERVAYQKFNREWVAEETNLDGDELTDFIAFCQFTPEYIVNTRLYDIRKKMMALLEKFEEKRSHKKEENRFSPGALQVIIPDIIEQLLESKVAIYSDPDIKKYNRTKIIKNSNHHA